MSRTRLDPAIFNLPVEKMRAGYYSDKYFTRTREVLRRDGASPRVTVQVYTKHDALLGGIDEAIAILKLCSDDWSALEVRALHDGDPITPWEVVLQIEGPYDQFARLDTQTGGLERLHRLLALAEGLRDIVDLQHRHVRLPWRRHPR